MTKFRPYGRGKGIPVFDSTKAFFIRLAEFRADLNTKLSGINQQEGRELFHVYNLGWEGYKKWRERKPGKPGELLPLEKISRLCKRLNVKNNRRSRPKKSKPKIGKPVRKRPR